jgi:hypothetical protein
MLIWNQEKSCFFLRLPEVAGCDGCAFATATILVVILVVTIFVLHSKEDPRRADAVVQQFKFLQSQLELDINMCIGSILGEGLW